jgi:hypothetical protein
MAGDVTQVVEHKNKCTNKYKKIKYFADVNSKPE